MPATQIMLSTELVIDRSTARPPICTVGRFTILWIMNCSIGWMAGCCISALVLVFVLGDRSHGPRRLQHFLVRPRCGADRNRDREPRADQQTADHAPGLSMSEAIQQPA